MTFLSNSVTSINPLSKSGFNKMLLNHRSHPEFNTIICVSFFSFPNSILNVTIHGISAALLNYTNVTGHTVPLKNTTVKLVVGLDDSELIVVPEATLIFPTETSPTDEGSIANKIAGFFGGSNKEEAEESIEEVATDDDSSKAGSKENPTSKGGQSEVEKAKEALKAENADTASKKQKVENMTIKLTVTRQSLGIQPMSTNDRIASGKLCVSLQSVAISGLQT